MIIVDFSKLQHGIAYNASGILHSISTNDPNDTLVFPLKLRVFRGRADNRYLFSPGFYDRLKKLGVEHIQVVISDSYGYPSNPEEFPGVNGDWQRWDTVVESTVAQCEKRKMTVEYDIWNEPDHKPFFWKRSQVEFFKTWQRAFQKIKTLKPGAIIIGPSPTHFNQTFLQDFLLFARDNHCLPNILSWHELLYWDHRKIPEHVKTIQAFMKKENIAIDRFSLNEIIPNDKHQSPGVLVSYIASIERTPVESSCRSCWSDGSQSNCENNSLDGLLTVETHLPRSCWWAHKFYADITGRLIQTTPFKDIEPYIDGLTGYDESSNQAIILLGQFAKPDSSSLNTSVHLIGLGQNHPLSVTGSIQIKVLHIPNTGSEPLLSPVLWLNTTLTIENNSLTIPLPRLAPDDACAIILSH